MENIPHQGADKDSAPANVDPNKQDLAEGKVDPSDKKKIKRDILGPIRNDESMYRFFKIVAYLVCIAFGAWFLCTGLNHATKILNAQETAIISNAHLIDAKTNYLNNQIKNSSSKISQKNDLENSSSDTKETSLSDKIISASSILTLFAFIFGVGLTLLLTLLKFSFNSQKEETNPELATPLGALFLDILKGLKDKISSK